MWIVGSHPKPHIETFDTSLSCKTKYSFKLRKLNIVLVEYRKEKKKPQKTKQPKNPPNKVGADIETQ